jgi:hypothetical protein
MSLQRQRKLVTHGGCVVVALPPDWLRGNGMNPGDVVELVYDGATVTVRPLRDGGGR